MVWPWVVAWVVGMVVVATAMQPKPEDQPPAEFEDLDVPVAEVGKEIPVLFGTRDISSPNVVWYGDLRVVPIRKKGGKK
ncbi:MAG: hypothetical protein ACR2PT_24295 [Endozoicomonas sp.]